MATRLGLGDRLRLGEGELKSGGFRRPSILADALEALLGAVYLDAGFDAVRTAVERLLGDRLESREDLPVHKDPKTALQELLQGRKLQLPRYSVQRTEGEALGALWRSLRLAPYRRGSWRLLARLLVSRSRRTGSTPGTAPG